MNTNGKNKQNCNKRFNCLGGGSFSDAIFNMSRYVPQKIRS